MTQLVITGTRHGRADVNDALDMYIVTFGCPSGFIVGDQAGVDDNAWFYARGVQSACDCVVFRVHVNQTLCSPDKFHDRNQRMVDRAGPGDHLLAFPDAKSRGTWDCFRRGQKAGLHCVEVKDGWVEKLHAMIAKECK